MNDEMFQSTLPAGEPELLRASAYSRYLDEMGSDGGEAGGGSSRLSSLSPSLRADLMRFEQEGQGTEVLEVVAALVRHAKRATVHLQCGHRVVPLTVFPDERLVHCPMDMTELLAKHLPTLRVMHVEPAVLRPPGDPEKRLIGRPGEHHSLEPLLWELALRGVRRELLPEIAGPAVYRVAPSVNMASLPISGAALAAVQRLRRATAPLAQIANWPGLNRERAERLLNALYLQAGLIISRSHPAAVNEGWFASLSR